MFCCRPTFRFANYNMADSKRLAKDKAHAAIESEDISQISDAVNQLLSLLSAERKLATTGARFRWFVYPRCSHSFNFGLFTLSCGPFRCWLVFQPSLQPKRRFACSRCWFCSTCVFAVAAGSVETKVLPGRALPSSALASTSTALSSGIPFPTPSVG